MVFKGKRSSLTVEESKARRLAMLEFSKWDEAMWKQKLREIWLKEGDKSTNFFHKMVHAPRRRNFLSKFRMNKD